MTGKEDVASLTTTDMERFERKLDTSDRREVGNTKEGKRESSDACYSWSRPPHKRLSIVPKSRRTLISEIGKNITTIFRASKASLMVGKKGI